MIDYEQYKKDCKEVDTWCPKCKHEIKYGLCKGSCGVKDKNGLTPNQCLYGDKF